MKWQNKAKDIILIALLVLILYFGIRQFFFLLFPLALSLIFSQVIRKNFTRLRPLSPGVKKILIVLVLLIFFSLCSLVVILFTEKLIGSISSLSGVITEHTDTILSFCQERVKWAERLISSLLHRDMENTLTSHLPGLFRLLLEKTAERIPSWIGALINFIPRFFISFFIFILCTYYFSCDWKRLSGFICGRIKQEKVAWLCLAKEKFLLALSRFVKAYLLLFLLTFSQLFLGFVLLRIPAPFTKAFFISFVDILPVLGTGTVLLPWAGILLLTGKGTLAAGLCILYAVILITRQFLEPKIVGDSIGLHPILSLLLVIGGLKFFGFFGMLFLPPLATCLWESIFQQKKT